MASGTALETVNMEPEKQASNMKSALNRGNHCRCGKSALYIDENGNFHACNYFKFNSAASVLDYDKFDDIWHNENLRAFTSYNIYNQCNAIVCQYN